MITTKPEDFVDKKTFEFANSFCRELEKNSPNWTVLNHYKAIRATLKNVSINNINASKVCELEKNSQITGKDDFRDFLIYCSEKNLIADSDIFLRLANFERGDFTNSQHRSKIYNLILQGDFYDRFVAQRGLPFSKTGRTVYLRQLTCPFADENMKREAEQFCSESIKLNAQHTLLTIKKELECFIELVTDYLSHISLKDFDRNSVLNNIGLLKNSTQLNQLNHFIAYLYAKGSFADYDYGKLVSDVVIPCYGIEHDKYIRLISSPDFNHIFLKRGNRSGLEIYRCDVHDEELFEIIKEYILSTPNYAKFAIFYFADNFESSAGSKSVLTLNTLKFENYISQIENIRKNGNFTVKEETTISSIITGFWLYIHTNYRNDLFSEAGIDPKILQVTGIGRNIVDGFKVVQYNPYEDVPDSDKWTVVITNRHAGNSDISGGSCYKVDFSPVINVTYRSWIKQWLWKANSSFATKRESYNYVIDFLNYVDGVHNGSIPSIYALPTADIKIRTEDCSSYKNYVLSRWGNNRTRMGKIYVPRSFMKYIDENDISEVPSGIFHYLTYTLSSDYNNTRALTDDEYKSILNLMKEKANNGIVENLSLIIFCLGVETEFRSSQIFSLKTGCVRETGVKTGEYVLISKTKTSNGEEIEQPITAYTKRRLDEIERLTQPYRDACPADDMKDLLFIVPSRTKKNAYVVFSNSQFNTYLQQCCKELGLPTFSFNNLRDTHMTRSEKFIAEKGLSPIQQNVLSGHSSPDVDTRNYSDMSLKDLMESVYGIIFGNVDITGKIVDKAPETSSEEENCVSCGRGYCSLKQCSDHSTVDCMLCSHFCTTVDREPYFDEAVRQLDAQIKALMTSKKGVASGTMDHDIQDLTKRKELCLAYKLAIIEHRKHKLQEVKS